MKSKITLPFLLLFFNQLVAQEVITTEVQDSFKTPQYEVVYDDVFLSKKETKSLLKIDATAFLNIGNDFTPGRRGLGIEYEHKISRYYSLNSGVFMDRDLLDRSSGLSLYIEPRWYFNQKANNLNGEYLALREELFILYQSNTTLKFGSQRRVYNNWYANFNAGLVYKNTFNNATISKNENTIGYVGDFTIGLAFGGGKKAEIEACNVFKCFEEEKSLFKIDLRGLLVELGENKFLSQPIIGFEHKLATAWSVNHEIRFDISSPKKSDFSKSQKFIAEYYLEPRYYYNMKKRIAQGKSANNLSGNYFSIAVGYRYLKEDFDLFGNPRGGSRENITKTFIFIPKFGIQRKIFNKGFVDISFAPFQYLTYNRVNKSVDNGRMYESETNRSFGWDFFAETYPYIDIRIGLAF
jgi:hypothetical protein